MSRRTLLGVWAHPDDEAYTSAGLMADFRRRGDRVVVITATLGEHGTGDPATWPPRRLAALRHTELRNSLAALDVDELHLLGYKDGDCEQGDGTQAIARHIADIDPDLIVTFGPDGMTGHPDHRAISRWTTDAWATTRPDADLLYATLTAEFHRRWGPVNDQIGLWADQPDPPCTADGRPGPEHPVARQPARSQGRRPRGPRLTDPTPHRTPRPGHLPRVVAHRIIPQAAPGAPLPHEAMIDNPAPSSPDGCSGSVRTSPSHGSLSMPNHKRQAVGTGWALVGDAATPSRRGAATPLATPSSSPTR